MYFQDDFFILKTQRDKKVCLNLNIKRAGKHEKKLKKHQHSFKSGLV